MKFDVDNIITESTHPIKPLMDVDELLPCPFCGDTDIDTWKNVLRGEYSDLDKMQYALACVKCGCRTVYKFSKEEAIKLWNTRSQSHAKLIADNAELRTAVKEALNQMKQAKSAFNRHGWDTCQLDGAISTTEQTLHTTAKFE